MKKLYFYLILILSIISCNKSDELFSGIKLGDDISEVKKEIETSKTISRMGCNNEMYSYIIDKKYIYSFDVYSANNKITTISGTISGMDCKYKHISLDEIDEIFQMLAAKYGSPRILRWNNDGVPMRECRWEKYNYNISFEHTLNKEIWYARLIYSLNEDLIKNLEEKESIKNGL